MAIDLLEKARRDKNGDSWAAPAPGQILQLLAVQCPRTGIPAYQCFATGPQYLDSPLLRHLANFSTLARCLWNSTAPR